MLTATLGRVRIWCSDRHGGVSREPYDSCNVGDHVGDDEGAVLENRRRVAHTAGLSEPTHWVWLDQVHGIDVLETRGPVPGPPPVADAAVSSETALPLAVMTADCAPVVLASEVAVSVVHAGHRGLVAGVIEAAIDRMRSLGALEVGAFLGPCIRVDRYEFGAADLARAVAALGPGVAGYTEAGRPAFDLPAGVRAALDRAGVHDVIDCGVCTAASPDHFSYRRDGTTGRQVTVAVLT